MTYIDLAYDEAQWQSFVLSRTHNKEFLDELNNYQLLAQDIYIVLGRKHANGVLQETLGEPSDLEKKQLKQVTGLLIGQLKKSSSKWDLCIFPST